MQQMVQYHIIGTYTSTYSMITDKDGEIMNGWTDEELKEFEEMMAFEERMEQDQEELRVKLNFHKQPHTDEEWKEHAIQSWLDAECTKEDLEKYYYYDSETHDFYPTEFGKEQRDKRARFLEKKRNLFFEAMELGIEDAFLAKAFDSPVRDVDEEDSQTNFNQDALLAQYYEDVPSWDDGMDTMRLRFLSDGGLSAATYDTPTVKVVDESYIIDGTEHHHYEMLYHHGELIGVYCDECSSYVTPAPHERHVEELLKIVKKHNIPLLLMYWDNDGHPTWEIYIDGKFVRQQTTPYTYDGFVYDKNKMSRMAALSEADIGSRQKALMELSIEASGIVYKDEHKIRVAETKQEHAKLAEEASRLQKEHQQLVSVFRKLNASAGDVFDEEYRNSACAALDTFSETIVPGLIASAYEEKAKKIYPFYPKVALSSQRYLLTAVALEEHLTAEHYDICPLYIELCRVFENELDIRIFSEYTNELLNLKEFKLQQGDHDEPCYRIIQQSVVKARREKAQQKKEKNKTKAAKDEIKVFVPERMKIKSLYKVEDDIGAESICQTRLLYFLKARQYKLEEFTDKTKFDAAYEYVENRNRFTHPDDKSDAADLQKELQSIKEQTNARMEWLIEATQGQE